MFKLKNNNGEKIMEIMTTGECMDEFNAVVERCNAKQKKKYCNHFEGYSMGFNKHCMIFSNDKLIAKFEDTA
ncbi:MAG TPA: hypothetical protein PLB45_00525 [Bacilli bacterium]|jgi:hypothetical protein|nr:hypothetical protein [Bacilli bacterium]HPZ23580.1 hypothetical protein [Bacilli bacterium]HQC83344.1 hypothetical protein [Bacilli bacterium]